jgi:hypothetical protein
VNWVSSEAKNNWESIFAACSNFFINLELEAVKAGLRGATVQTCSPDALERNTSEMMEQGLSVIPIDKVPAADIYLSSGVTLKEGEPWNYKVAIGRFDKVRELVRGYKEGDNEAIGKVLGYPLCCVKFFNRYWISENWIDTSFHMAGGKEDHYFFSPYCNILLRWLGLRYVSHLPCSFICEDTATIGNSHYQLALDMGLRTLADQLYDILSWSVEWSGLHGIGFITTPVCRITMRTDMFKKRQVVRLHGKKMPRSAAHGLTFPFISRESKISPNGFYNEDDEKRAHNLLIDLVRMKPPKSVIDLGCGNRALLLKMSDEFKCTIYGVDDSAEKKPDFVGDVFSLQDFPRDFDLALISKARIRENAVGWYHLLRIIEKRCKFLVVYSYDGDREQVSIGDFRPISGVTDQHYNADLYMYD